MHDVIIIGGGIVGLATAWQIRAHSPHRSMLVLEKEYAPAQHQTGHNSGVIHSGLYYKPGSLKAKNCTKGYHLLLDFCRKEGVPFELCGKLVVATDQAELPYLRALFERGKQNGLTGLKWLKHPSELQAYEPYVKGEQGIFVPQTGITDYRAVCQKLESSLLRQGVSIRYGEKVTRIQARATYSETITPHGTYASKIVVNCAGLYSDQIARLTPCQPDLKIIPFRGEYYQLKPKSKHLVKHLIYPVPNPNFPFLGVHFTRMLNGSVEAGPNAVLAFAREGYSKNDIHLKELLETIAWTGFQKVAIKYWKTGWNEFYRSFSKKAFTRALQKLIPDITPSDLQSGGAGVRAQACSRQGQLLDDFHVLEDRLFIHVCNAPSPAATSSLAIGHHIAARVLHRLR